MRARSGREANLSCHTDCILLSGLFYVVREQISLICVVVQPELFFTAGYANVFSIRQVRVGLLINSTEWTWTKLINCSIGRNFLIWKILNSYWYWWNENFISISYPSGLLKPHKKHQGEYSKITNQLFINKVTDLWDCPFTTTEEARTTHIHELNKMNPRPPYDCFGFLKEPNINVRKVFERL